MQFLKQPKSRRARGLLLLRFGIDVCYNIGCNMLVTKREKRMHLGMYWTLHSMRHQTVKLSQYDRHAGRRGMHEPKQLN